MLSAVNFQIRNNIEVIFISTSATEGGRKLYFHPCLSVCLWLFVCSISQKVVDGFGLNLVDMLGVWQGRTDSILVKIQIRIRLLFFLYTLSRLVWKLTHNAQQGGHETTGVGVGRKKQWGTKTLGDLWKGEGWAGEHGECKMDFKPLSHLDVLASVCRLMKNLANTLAHVEYVMGKFCIP